MRKGWAKPLRSSASGFGWKMMQPSPLVLTVLRLTGGSGRESGALKFHKFDCAWAESQVQHARVVVNLA